jgi:hypothetical protein
MRKVLIAGVASLFALTACANLGTNLTNLLEDNGVSTKTAVKVGQIASDAVSDGALFCSLDGIVAAVPTVSVVQASAAAVAGACKTATVLGAAAATVAIPVPPPAVPTSVPVATVTPAAAAAVAASVTPAKPS